MSRRAAHLLHTLTSQPEFSVAVFALLLNLPWELLQVPFFSEMPSAEHWRGVKTCVQATAGDAVIMLLAYWAAGISSRDRFWLCRPKASQLFIFFSAGVLITIAIERLALAGVWRGGWSYSDRMYVIPALEVGLSPVLQWLVLPPIVLWFARRQVLGTSLHAP